MHLRRLGCLAGLALAAAAPSWCWNGSTSGRVALAAGHDPAHAAVSPRCRMASLLHTWLGAFARQERRALARYLPELRELYERAWSILLEKGWRDPRWRACCDRCLGRLEEAAREGA